MRRRALIVLGMHRSGTSALTRVLNLAGAFLPDKLMPPVPGNNERGFWEPVELVAASTQALAAAGVTWDSPRRIHPEWFGSESAEHTVFELVRFLERNYADQRLFVLKDPRLCRIVPLLQKAARRCGIDAGFVLILRHPDAVAASLAARDGIPRDQGRALWLRYSLDAERWTRGAPRVVVGFGELMSDWRGVAARVGRRLRVHLRTGPEVRGVVSEFLEPLLVHHPAHDDEPLSPLIGGAWSAMLRLQAGRDTRQGREKLDHIWTALDVADEVLGAAFSWETSLRQRMEQRAKAAERERDASGAELARIRADHKALSALQRELEELRRANIVAKEQAERIRAVENALRERDESVRGLRAQLETARAELEGTRLQAQRKHQELEAARAELAQRKQQELEAARAELESARLQVQRKQQELEAARAELEGSRLQAQRRQQELESGAKRLDERLRFLQSMAQAALERARVNGNHAS